MMTTFAVEEDASYQANVRVIERASGLVNERASVPGIWQANDQLENESLWECEIDESLVRSIRSRVIITRVIIAIKCYLVGKRIDVASGREEACVHGAASAFWEATECG
jgi:hypothetical protein